MNLNQSSVSYTPVVVVGEESKGGWCEACETNGVTVITGRDAQLAWCVGCLSRLDLATIDFSTGDLSVSSRAIIRWVKVGECHFIQTREGLILASTRTDARRRAAGGAELESSVSTNEGGGREAANLGTDRVGVAA